MVFCFFELRSRHPWQGIVGTPRTLPSDDSFGSSADSRVRTVCGRVLLEGEYCMRVLYERAVLGIVKAKANANGQAWPRHSCSCKLHFARGLLRNGGGQQSDCRQALHQQQLDTFCCVAFCPVSRCRLATMTGCARRGPRRAPSRLPPTATMRGRRDRVRVCASACGRALVLGRALVWAWVCECACA